MNFKRKIIEWMFLCPNCEEDTYFNSAQHSSQEYKCQHCSFLLGSNGKFTKSCTGKDISKPNNWEYMQ